MNKWYLDAINEKLFVRGSRKLAREVLEVDAKVVDGVVNLTGLLTLGSGEGLKYLEIGRAQFYALIVFAGVIGLVVLFGVIGTLWPEPHPSCVIAYRGDDSQD